MRVFSLRQKEQGFALSSLGALCMTLASNKESAACLTNPRNIITCTWSPPVSAAKYPLVATSNAVSRSCLVKATLHSSLRRSRSMLLDRTIARENEVAFGFETAIVSVEALGLADAGAQAPLERFFAFALSIGIRQ